MSRTAPPGQCPMVDVDAALDLTGGARAHRPARAYATVREP
ncbi:hypothetical protein ACTMSW_30350 [Micromonospora sp. BQ11]